MGLKFFQIREFACKHCGEAKMDSKFLKMIDNAREIAGLPFHITSGYRCPVHNKNVGSTSTNHVKGLAADITCRAGPTRLKIVEAMLAVGFKRIGIHKNFIHCDINEGPESIWLY